MASNMHHGSVADRYECFAIDKEATADRRTQRLVADAKHAAGNLIHRLHYLVGMLEDDPSREESAEAIAEMKGSLAQLHQIVNETLALMRPVALRPIRIRLGDLVVSIAQRFSCQAWEPASEGGSEGLGQLQLDCDPSQLDRALSLLSSRLTAPARHHAAASLGAFAAPCIEVGRRRGAEIVGVIVRWQMPRAQRCGEATDAIAVQLAVATAARLLSLHGWSLELRDEQATTTVSIFVPVVPATDARSTPASTPL